ncbi:hypothetical protein ACFLS1_08495 [Verrucomicrobiota bacterium]
MKKAGLVLLFVLFACLVGFAQEPAELDVSKNATLPYAHLYQVFQSFGNKQVAPHVRLITKIKSKSPDIAVSDIILYIDSKNGRIPVKIDKKGLFDFPCNEGLLEENPAVIANQPKGSLDLLALVTFEKQAGKKEEIKYSEVMLPITLGLHLQQQAGEAGKNAEGLYFKFTGKADPGKHLVINSKDGDLILRPDDNGLMLVPFKPKFFIEDPLVLFPKAGASFFDFKFSATKEGKKRSVREKEDLSKEKQDKINEDLSNWFTYYYLHPQPGLISVMLQKMESSEMLKDANAQSPVVGFFSVLFQKNEDITLGILQDSLELNYRLRHLLWTAFWLADTSSVKKHFKTIQNNCGNMDQIRIETLLSKKPFKIEKKDIEAPSELDMLWGAFFASGEGKYVERIISVLPWAKEDDIEKLIVGGAANWSLASNSTQHPKVLEICKEEGKEATGVLKDLLEKIIAEAEGKQPESDRSQEIIEKLKKISKDSVTP